MPSMDGFDVVEALLRREWPEAQSIPFVSFVTAHPQFASAAFETGALDFLCKPVRLARLEKTIRRAGMALEQREAASRLRELSGQLNELRQNIVRTGNRSIWVQRRRDLVRLDIASLDWVQAEGEYVRLHAGGESYLTRSSISAIAAELTKHGFVRIHRSVVVNSARLSAVRRVRGSGLRAILDTAVELPVGRRFRASVKALTST